MVKINLHKDDSIMHSITKNHLSKILALTTIFSSIAILPVAKASGTEPENIPQLQNSRSETQVITDEMINQAIAELNERLGGTDVVRCSPAFLSNRPVAYKILQKLISCFELREYHGGFLVFTAEYRDKFIRSGKKLYLKSLSEASDHLVLSCYKDRDVNASITIGDIPTPDVPSEDITPNAVTMFFNWTKERDKYRYYDVDSITSSAHNSFMQIVTNPYPFACGHYEPCMTVYEPVRKEEPKSILRPPSSLSSDDASSEHVRQTVLYEYIVPDVSRSSDINSIFGLNSDSGGSCSFYTTERDLEKVKKKLREKFCKRHRMESFTQEEYNIAKKERGVEFNDGGQAFGNHYYDFEGVSHAIEDITRKEVPVRIYNCGDHKSPEEWCCIIYDGYGKVETIVYLPNRSYFDSTDQSWQEFLSDMSTFDGMIKHTKELISTPPDRSTVRLIEGKTDDSFELLDNDLECTGISMNIEWLE